MRANRYTAFAVSLVIGFTVVFFSPNSLAQRKHAPKETWKSMLASLNDIQAMVAALTVFDMERLAGIADRLAARERKISEKHRHSQKSKEYHVKISETVREIALAARKGDERRVAEKIGETLATCSGCHYNVRDAARRR